jgi:Peptidase M66
VNYFSDVTGDYPAGTFAELEAKWPVADLEIRRIPDVIFRELVIPPRYISSTLSLPAARIKSPSDYFDQTGQGFDGEQAAALAWNAALKRAAGRSGRTSLYFINIYGANAGGQAGGFAGVGNGTSQGILHHELGHALNLPHWGDAVYPYKGDMYGILAPNNYNGTHAGPVWAYDLRTQTFIPPTVQPGNVGNQPVGTYKVDPMQGGGTGWQEPGFLMNHFSDYSVFKMREYLHGHVLIWNQILNSYASWNQTTGDYTTTVSNNGVQYPLERDAQVISVMASISGAKPNVNMVYPPIGPYTAGLIRLFDPRVSADRSAAVSTGYAPYGGCDLSLRLIQGGVEKIYMLAAPWEPTLDPLSSNSLKTEAINLPAADGEVTLAELLLTPDAQINGLPLSPQVIATWAPITPDPAGFSVSPIAGSSSAISMTAIAGISEKGPVEYLFTETSGNPGGSSSGWQSSPFYTDIGLQPSTIYSYTVTMRAGAYTGRSSAAVAASTTPPGIPGTITFDKFLSAYTSGATKTFTFDASASDKLVVIVSGEHNFGGNLTGNVKTVTYDGVSLTKAVEQNPVSATLVTTSDLWYLDNPGAAHTAGQIIITVEGNGNNYVHTAIGLSGTAPGFFGATAIATGTPTLNMNVSAPSSLVISWLTLGGSGNTASTATTIQSSAPAGATKFGGVATGGSYAGHVLARSSGLAAGMKTFSFNTALTDVICLSAEFLAAEIPASAYQIWSSQFPGSDLTNPALDLDKGGLPTGIEWVLGGNPTIGSDDAGIAPTINTTSDPNGKMLFTFRRRDVAKLDPKTTIAVEYGSALTGWTAATQQGTGANQITITEAPSTPGFTNVTVALPSSLAVSGKLFVRLKAAVVTP